MPCSNILSENAVFMFSVLIYVILPCDCRDDGLK